jgi:hypothetical protein
MKVGRYVKFFCQKSMTIGKLYYTPAQALFMDWSLLQPNEARIKVCSATGVLVHSCTSWSLHISFTVASDVLAQAELAPYVVCPRENKTPLVPYVFVLPTSRICFALFSQTDKVVPLAMGSSQERQGKMHYIRPVCNAFFPGTIIPVFSAKSTRRKRHHSKLLLRGR